MLIYIMETVRGSEDGFKVRRFHEGQTYDIAQSLAAGFIRNGKGLHLPEEDLPGFEMNPNSIRLSGAEALTALPNPEMAGFNVTREAKMAAWEY